MPNMPLPEWEALLSSAAHLQRIVPDAVLIVRRNATRDYLDFVAMSELIGREATVAALECFDRLYPQPNGQSARQQLQVQLANPLPYDLEETNLAEYKKLKPEYQDWALVSSKCREIANALW